MSINKSITGYGSDTSLKRLHLVSNISKDEYLNFHKMIATPNLISKCTKSFNGKNLIIPKTPNKDLSKYEITSLNCKYYLLMGLTFTTISTILGMTTVYQADEDINGIQSDNTLPVNIQNHLNLSQEHLIIRKYVLHFKIPNIKLEIFHIKDKDLLHMVTIFSDEHRVIQIYILLFILSIILMLCTYILYSNNYFNFSLK